MIGSFLLISCQRNQSNFFDEGSPRENRNEERNEVSGLAINSLKNLSRIKAESSHSSWKPDHYESFPGKEDILWKRNEEFQNQPKKRDKEISIRKARKEFRCVAYLETIRNFSYSILDYERQMILELKVTTVMHEQTLGLLWYEVRRQLSR